MVTEVLCGHLAQAQAWLEKAERSGVDPGRIRVLRGLAAVERGDDEAAIRDLEPAWQQMPDSLAACSLLFRAYSGAGRIREANMLWDKLRRLTPGRPEDYLWGAWAVEEWSTERAIEWLEHLVAEHPTPVAYYRLGRVRALRLMEDQRVADIDRVLVPLAAAVSEIPEYSWGHYYYHKASLAAADMCRVAGDIPRSQHYLNAAEQEAQRVLAEHADWARAYTINANQAMYDGRWEDALSYLRAGLGRPDSWPLDRFAVPLLLYRLGRYPEMLAELRAMPETLASFAAWFRLYAYAAAEVEGADAAAAVLEPKLEHYLQDAGRNDGGASYVIYCFLGRPDDAVRRTRAWRDQFQQSGEGVNQAELGQYSVRYECGELSADVLLGAVATARPARLSAQFLVGLTCLAYGDRVGAVEQFTNVEQAGNWLFSAGSGLGGASAWAEFFLLRLRADPTWPPWIPVKEGNDATRQPGSEGKGFTQPAASGPGEEQP